MTAGHMTGLEMCLKPLIVVSFIQHFTLLTTIYKLSMWWWQENDQTTAGYTTGAWDMLSPSRGMLFLNFFIFTILTSIYWLYTWLWWKTTKWEWETMQGLEMHWAPVEVCYFSNVFLFYYTQSANIIVTRLMEKCPILFQISSPHALPLCNGF